MLTLRIHHHPARKRILGVSSRAFRSVDLCGEPADLEGLRDGLRTVKTIPEKFEINAEWNKGIGRICIYRSEGALAVLETEHRLILAGDRLSLEELALKVQNVLINASNPRSIEGFHAHAEFWDGDSERGPAGDLTIYLAGTYRGSEVCPRGCQPIG